MRGDRELFALVAVLVALVVITGIGAALAWSGDRVDAAVILGLATGLIGALKMPSAISSLFQPNPQAPAGNQAEQENTQ